MILIDNDLVNLDICDLLKNLAIKNKHIALPFRDIHVLILKELNSQLTRSLGAYLTSFLGSKGMALYPELIQLTLWEKGSKQDMHFDNSRETTKLTSITYLNDDFDGGETYFEKGLIIKPEKGKTIFFDGKRYLHGVKPLENNPRYVMAIWYTSDINYINI